MRTVMLLTALLVSTPIVLGSSPTAEAGTTSCTGVLIGGTLDNVVVPRGAKCQLEGVTVRGNVKALRNAWLLIGSNSEVHGNVEGEEADVVQIVGSSVHGNISIEEGGPASAPVPAGFWVCNGVNTNVCEALVLFSQVHSGTVHIERMVGSVFVWDSVIAAGHLRVERNYTPASPESLVLSFNQVAQHLVVFGNKGPGDKAVTNNDVGDTIWCFVNSSPFVGGPNPGGHAKGQCSE